MNDLALDKGWGQGYKNQQGASEKLYSLLLLWKREMFSAVTTTHSVRLSDLTQFFTASNIVAEQLARTMPSP